MSTRSKLLAAAVVALSSAVVLGQSTTNPATSSPTPPVSATTTSVAPAPATQPAGASATQPAQPTAGNTVIVSAPRVQVAPALGAKVTTITPQEIKATPGGQNAPLQQIIVHNVPSAVEDSYGQYHIRGEHNNLTYRVNGVLLPEGLNGFGQELDSRIIQSASVLTGSLPAQFGFRTAGIIDVTTKSGESLNHNELSLYGGSWDTVEPSLQVGGTDDKLDYFAVGSFNHNNLGIENPTSSSDPIHDATNQNKLFLYLSYHIDDTSRLSVLANANYSDFQIPNNPGQKPVYQAGNQTSYDSATTNENQNEQDYYSVVEYQKDTDEFGIVAAAYSRFGQIRFGADPVNDLAFLGAAGNVRNTFVTSGVQLDGSYVLDEEHTLRAGLVASYTQEYLDTLTGVFPANPDGSQASTTPFYIPDDSGNYDYETGIYIQDEWKLNPQWTFNYGLRYDRFDANFENADQVSPRANLVWKPDPVDTFHGGYSRYFAPPPPQYVAVSTLNKFAGTTNAPANFKDSPTPVERSNYYDFGYSRQLTPAWQASFDSYYKDCKNLNDLGQFGVAEILSPYAYAKGYVYGMEASSEYKKDGWDAFGNFAWCDTGAKGIVSSQYQFSAADLAYISNHYIHLDHEANYTASAGLSYTWTDNMAYVDLLYGSGLRTGFDNTGKLPSYVPVSVGYEHTFHPWASDRMDLRFRIDCINLFDQVYQIRSGSGIGVFAPQFGARRTFLAGLTFDF
ncbi:MAG TPA: TonB-dependent receptor [Tepidisphaeraceae bacterium]|nr:TonB-dependent receptor [Tepidisphaeraceae bacterium]